MFYQKVNELEILFGVEIEITGISKENACRLLAKIINGRAYNSGTRWWTLDSKGRTWRIVSDGSVRKEVKMESFKIDKDTILDIYTFDTLFNQIKNSFKDSSIEIVTPPCTIQDLSLILRIAHEFKENGAIANNSCGIHIHVSSPKLTPGKLKNLIKLTSILEPFIFKVFNVDKSRQLKYCKPIEPKFVEEINKLKCKNKSILMNTWYNLCSGNTSIGRDDRTSKYHYSRYHGFNLHSLSTNGTVEFRYFNSTLDTKSIETYILFCIAMIIYSIECKSFSFAATPSRVYHFSYYDYMNYIAAKFKLNEFPHVCAYLYDSIRTIKY